MSPCTYIIIHYSHIVRSFFLAGHAPYPTPWISIDVSLDLRHQCLWKGSGLAPGRGGTLRISGVLIIPSFHHFNSIWWFSFLLQQFYTFPGFHMFFHHLVFKLVPAIFRSVQVQLRFGKFANITNRSMVDFSSANQKRSGLFWNTGW